MNEEPLPLGNVTRAVSLVDGAHERLARVAHIGTHPYAKLHAAMFELMRGEQRLVAGFAPPFDREIIEARLREMVRERLGEIQEVLLAQALGDAAHVAEPLAKRAAFSRRQAFEKGPVRSPQRQIMLTRETGGLRTVLSGAHHVAFAEAIAHLGKAIEMADKAGDAERRATGSAAVSQRLPQMNAAYGNALIAARGHGAREKIEAFARTRKSASGDEDAPAGRLVELGERERRAQFEAAGLLRLRDGNGGPKGLFGRRGVFWIALQQGFAAGPVELRFERAVAEAIGRRQRFIEDRNGAKSL